MSEENVTGPAFTGTVTHPITGYRELTAVQVGMINKLKEAEGLIGELRYAVECMPHDGRMLAIGWTQIQLGFMAINRAVARPMGD